MKQKLKWFFLLHLLLGVYSTSGIFSKLAGMQRSASLSFFLLYGCVLFLLMLYAVGWQQIIKHLPLTTAYANKAVTVIWGLVYGAVFFRESVTPRKLLGAAVIIAGVLLYVSADKEDMP